MWTWPRPKGSETTSGRYANAGSGDTSSTETRSGASARSASAVSMPATPPPAMTTRNGMLRSIRFLAAGCIREDPESTSGKPQTVVAGFGAGTDAETASTVRIQGGEEVTP